MHTITIVTVSYNAENDIERTIKSVLNQTYPHIEYIIIDGASTDGTIDIIKKHEDKIDYWVSEPDEGLYYAMNKAIGIATGEWVNFMNAGDTFADKRVIEWMIEQSTSDADIYYGSRYRHYSPSNIKLEKCWSINEMLYVMPFGHQATFSRNSILKDLRFDTSFRLSADYDFFVRCYLKKYTFTYVGFPVCNFESGGLSQQQNFKSEIETIKLLTDYAGKETVKKSFYYRSFKKKHFKEYEKKLAAEKVKLVNTEKHLTKILTSKNYKLGQMIARPYWWIKKKIKQ